MRAINAARPVRQLVVRQRHVHGRELGRLLQPADRLQGRELGVQVLEGEPRVHDEGRVGVAGGDAVYADPFLDELARDAVDEAAQRRLGGRVGESAGDRDEARDRVGDDDGGAWGQERGGGLDDVEVCVEVDLHGMVPDFWGHLDRGLERSDCAVVVAIWISTSCGKTGDCFHTALDLPSVTDDQIQGSQFLMGRVDELVAEFWARQVPRDPDQLVLDTRVLFQEIGQGLGIGLLFGQIIDGDLGALPGNGDCSIGN